MVSSADSESTQFVSRIHLAQRFSASSGGVAAPQVDVQVGINECRRIQPSLSWTSGAARPSSRSDHRTRDIGTSRTHKATRRRGRPHADLVPSLRACPQLTSRTVWFRHPLPNDALCFLVDLVQPKFAIYGKEIASVDLPDSGVCLPGQEAGWTCAISPSSPR
jgi:hypothetical protein